MGVEGIAGGLEGMVGGMGEASWTTVCGGTSGSAGGVRPRHCGECGLAGAVLCLGPTRGENTG